MAAHRIRWLVAYDGAAAQSARRRCSPPNLLCASASPTRYPETGDDHERSRGPSIQRCAPTAARRGDRGARYRSAGAHRRRGLLAATGETEARRRRMPGFGGTRGPGCSLSAGQASEIPTFTSCSCSYCEPVPGPDDDLETGCGGPPPSKTASRTSAGRSSATFTTGQIVASPRPPACWLGQGTCKNGSWPRRPRPGRLLGEPPLSR